MVIITVRTSDLYFNCIAVFPFKALKKIEVQCYKQEKLREQQTKMLVKQVKELRLLEERAAQANVLRKAFRYFG
jgi:hypothetical protein